MNPEIIIAGAGPVGLLAAINLISSGISVRIFEEKAERSELSRALVVHAGTLELLEVVQPSLLKKFLERGKKIQRMEVGEKYAVNLAVIPSRYNFLLVLEQQETEEILENYLEKLGGKVERSCKIIDATNDTENDDEISIDNQNNREKVIVVIERTNENIGEKFLVTCDYLLDCSGAHSVIRKDILQIPFCGEKYFGRIFMGDIKVKGFWRCEVSRAMLDGQPHQHEVPKVNCPFSNNVGRITRSAQGIAAVVPLNHENYFRVILIPFFSNEFLQKIEKKISLAEFHELARIIAPQLELGTENKWLTSFSVSHRMIKKLRVGRIFLAGDAAHIHSPVGGQGMNLGMQDAFNICDKLRRVLRESASEKILDDYEKQRLPIIAKVVKLTDAMMNSGVEKSFFSMIAFFILQKIFAPVFFRSKFLQRKVFGVLAQLGSARQEIHNIKLFGNNK